MGLGHAHSVGVGVGPPVGERVGVGIADGVGVGEGVPLGVGSGVGHGVEPMKRAAEKCPSLAPPITSLPSGCIDSPSATLAFPNVCTTVPPLPNELSGWPFVSYLASAVLGPKAPAPTSRPSD